MTTAPPPADPATAVAATATPAFADRRCVQCGSAFGCGVAADRCWCHDVTLSAATLAQLRERYDTCLCPACLRGWAGSGPSTDTAESADC